MGENGGKGDSQTNGVISGPQRVLRSRGRRAPCMPAPSQRGHSTDLSPGGSSMVMRGLWDMEMSSHSSPTSIPPPGYIPM